MFAVFDNADVSHFRTCGILSLINFAVDDNTAADTRSEGYHNRVLHAFCRTGYCFSERRHIGVVAEIYGLAYMLLHKFAKRYVRAVFEVVGIDKSAVFRIKISGAAYTYRNLAAYAEKYIGKPVIIENLEGGSGSIGWTALSQAAPDGYTLGFINLPNFNATISEGLATYTVDSFAPICNHVTETSVVLVKADSQFNTLEDLVKFAKDNPGKLKASTNGNRASNHIGAQVLATSAGFEYTDIPYGGTADQLLALRQGEVDFSVAKVADFASFTSEVKVLAVYNQERLEGYPDVPTMGELGYYDQWLGSSRCIVAPAGTPENVIKFYEDAFQKLMEDADYLKAAEAAGMETDYKNSADTAALIKQQQDFTESLADVWGD